MPDTLNLSYPGSSGFGVQPGGRYGSVYTAPPGSASTGSGVDPSDYGVYDPSTGRVVSFKTGRPFTGKEPRTGQYYNAGVVSQPPAGQQFIPGTQTPIDPNNPTQRYKPVDIPKLPAVATAADDLLKTFQQGADQSLKGFNDYLKTFRSQMDQSNKLSQQAIAGNAQTEADLQAGQNRYQTQLDKSASDYAALNAADAARQAGIIQEAKDILPQYDAAANAIGDRQTQALMQQLSRYKAGSGTPMSLGSDEERILAQGVADVRLPLAQQQIQRQYDIVTGLELPIEQQLAARETARIGQFNPYVAGQEFTSGQNTAQTISNLRMVTAGMSYDNATRYLQSIGVPAALWSQILGQQAGNLGQIAGLEEGSRYLGLQDVLGAVPSQPQYYSMSTPGYPSNRYGSPPVNVNNPLNAPGAPVNVGAPAPASTDPAAQYFAQTGYYPNQDPYYSPYAMSNIQQADRYASAGV